ncbi:FK506-binding protein 4-like [Bradysia coprophila]|uniref:FK506-binding protein 4-like n=1 Tax=Bradysia coprophila TaxID=38358 RepID=UPI00187DAF8F|nr:FK506-binding protein 4-like [Bradysia coprophila]
MNLSCIVLISLACLVLTSYASPIQIVEAHPTESKSDLTLTNTIAGRQTAAAAVPAVPAAVDDDDDDDDEDDIEDALDDDDDDDDEEGGAADDDDDDDDDYLERFFDDILGDDDDDDDDDVSPSTGQVQQPAQQPSAPTAVADEVAGGDYPAGDVDAVYDDDQQVEDNGVQVLDTAPGDTVKEPSETVSAVAAPATPIGAVNVAAAEEEEDDEEDEIEDALDVDDDDDDEDDDDDDEDDLIGDDVIEARGARGLKDNSVPVPDILINKYNRFVDGIFGRINKILKRSYDPVSVRLSTGETKTKKTKTTTKKRKTTTRTKTSQKSRTASPINQSEIDQNKNDAPRVDRNLREVEQPIAVGIPETFLTTSSKDVPSETRTVSSKKTTEKRVTKRTKTKSKTKQATKKQAEREGAHGVLYGLSTLTRQGNVRVNAVADYTTVKSNFVLGPLVLKVEKAFGRGAKRELKSATATTTEMIGRINLRIVNGAATLHSIKVQQPKQVQVDSADNHDKTRKFVWKKSSHIAQVVSQQLTAAARSMLQPPPSTN